MIGAPDDDRAVALGQGLQQSGRGQRQNLAQKGAAHRLASGVDPRPGRLGDAAQILDLGFGLTFGFLRQKARGQAGVASLQ